MGYRVTAQRQTSVISDSGQIQNVMEVTISTDEGVTAHVDIPISQYNPTNVKAQLDALYANIQSTHQITG